MNDVSVYHSFIHFIFDYEYLLHLYYITHFSLWLRKMINKS